MREKSEYILGIETSGRIFSIALVRDGRVSGFRSRGAGRKLDAVLLPGIKNLLDSAGISPRELSGVAVSTGPGYFTGIRTGMAAAMGISFALGIPAAGVMSLDSAAFNVSPPEKCAVCAALEAGRSKLYHRLYLFDPDLPEEREPIGPPALSSPEELAKSIDERTVLLCASEDGAKKIKNSLGDRIIVLPSEFALPSAARTAILGRKLIGSPGELPELKPVYIRRTDAEETLAKDLSETDISPAGEKDLPEIMRIERASFPTPWAEDMFRSELIRKQGLFLAARKKGEITGYACGWFAADEFHLANIAVAPGERSRGTGGKLLKYIIDKVKSREARFIILEVRHKNEAAFRLYEKFGFRRVAKRKRYYADTGEDAVLMELEI